MQHSQLIQTLYICNHIAMPWQHGSEFYKYIWHIYKCYLKSVLIMEAVAAHQASANAWINSGHSSAHRLSQSGAVFSLLEQVRNQTSLVPCVYVCVCDFPRVARISGKAAESRWDSLRCLSPSAYATDPCVFDNTCPAAGPHVKLLDNGSSSGMTDSWSTETLKSTWF